MPNILVVDDYEPICELIELVLVRVGYRVCTTTSGNDALRIARDSAEIHLILCGGDLSDMHGEEFVEKFMEVHPRASIVFVSDSIAAVEMSHPFRVLDKPFTTVELRDVVHCALREQLDAIG